MKLELVPWTPDGRHVTAPGRSHEGQERIGCALVATLTMTFVSSRHFPARLRGVVFVGQAALRQRGLNLLAGETDVGLVTFSILIAAIPAMSPC